MSFLQPAAPQSLLRKFQLRHEAHLLNGKEIYHETKSKVLEKARKRSGKEPSRFVRVWANIRAFRAQNSYYYSFGSNSSSSFAGLSQLFFGGGVGGTSNPSPTGQNKK